MAGVGKHHDDAGDEHAEGHGEKAAHGAQGQVFVDPPLSSMDRPMGTLKAMVEAHMKPMAVITGNRSALWPISVARAKETPKIRRHDDRGGYHRISAKEGRIPARKPWR